MPTSADEDLLSTAKRTSKWLLSQDIPSDVLVLVGGSSFSLHKFPLMSKCGYIRKLVSQSELGYVIELPDVPGGDGAFELAAKFCYGINFEINLENVAALRCVAGYLEIEDLVRRSESYIVEEVLRTVSAASSVLHLSENLLPAAEEVGIVARCVDAIASLACEESKLEQKWWAEDLIALRIDFFERVSFAMVSKGFKQCALGPVLMLYVQNSLRGLASPNRNIAILCIEKRVVVETMAKLLPRERNALSVSFLSFLLRAAVCVDATVACRHDLERRMGMQLAHASLDDLFIPSHTMNAENTLLDVDIVQRIMTHFLESDEDGEADLDVLSDTMRVAKLVETYLAEIGSDENMSVSKFIGLAELVPQHSGATGDGMYRAIDIYLKAHPGMSEMEKKSICSLMECEKLSREACAHAAHNSRLPVQKVVQVLHFEQQRMLGGVTDNGKVGGGESHLEHELSKLREENNDLKVEVAKLKLMLKEDGDLKVKSQISSPANGFLRSDNKPPLPRKSFRHVLSKGFGRLSPLFGSVNGRVRGKPSKERRHSIS